MCAGRLPDVKRGAVPDVKLVQQPIKGQVGPGAIASRPTALKREGRPLTARQLPPASRQLPPASRQLHPASRPPPPASRQPPLATRPPPVLASFGRGGPTPSASFHGAARAQPNHAAQQASRSFPVLPAGKAEAGKPRAVQTGGLPLGAVPLSTASRSFPVMPAGEAYAWKPHAAPAAPPAPLASGLATAQPQVDPLSHIKKSQNMVALCATYYSSCPVQEEGPIQHRRFRDAILTDGATPVSSQRTKHSTTLIDVASHFSGVVLAKIWHIVVGGTLMHRFPSIK